MALLRRKRDWEIEDNRYLLWILIGVELFMSFSSLGYVHFEPMYFTLGYLPVLVAGCLLGPGNSAVVGTVFGTAVMWKASVFYLADTYAFFSPVMSGKPLISILLSVGAGALFGFVAGLLYRAAKNGRYPLPGILLVSSLGRTLYAAFVYGFAQLLIPESGFRLGDILSVIRREDFLPSILVADAVVLACYLLSGSSYIRGILKRVCSVDPVNELSTRSRAGMGAMLAVVLLASVSVALFFLKRIGFIFEEYGVEAGKRLSYDVMHLQIQFLLGMLSLALIAVIFIIMFQKNYHYLYYEAKLDGLTGLMGRLQFFQMGRAILRDMKFDQAEKAGCFVVLDVDCFKEINDRYGHPEGDRVLIQVADCLRDAVGKNGILGRLGGDEFVALIRVPMTKEEVESKMDRLRESLATVRIGERTATCSIGVIPLEPDLGMEELYRSADHLLYEAKKRGRNQVVLGYRYRDAQGGEKAAEFSTDTVRSGRRIGEKQKWRKDE